MDLVNMQIGMLHLRMTLFFFEFIKSCNQQ